VEALKEKWHSLSGRTKAIILVVGAVIVIYFLHRSGTATTTAQAGKTIADPNGTALPSPAQLPDTGSSGSTTGGTFDQGYPPAQMPAPVTTAPSDPSGYDFTPHDPTPPEVPATNDQYPSYPSSSNYIPAPQAPPTVAATLPPPLPPPAPLSRPVASQPVISAPTIPHTMPVAPFGPNPFAAGNPAYSWYEPNLSGMVGAQQPAAGIAQGVASVAIGSPKPVPILKVTMPTPTPYTSGGGTSAGQAKMQ
jgi:hypothetical protein